MPIKTLDFLELGSLLSERAIGLPIAKLSRSRVLLTGATGLIGLNLLALLSELKSQFGLDFDLVTSSKSPLPKFIVDISVTKKHLEIDLARYFDVSKLGKFDFIIHSGGSAQPQDFMSKKSETYYINSFATKELLELLNPGGQFVFMSSTELYSGLKTNIFSESDIGSTGPMHPRACYIEGKRAGEMFVNWKITEGFRASSVRLSYTYGPGTKSNDLRVINTLIRDAITLGETKLKDEGLARRSNLFSLDAAHMILQILLSPSRAVYNVAARETATIKDIAKEISLIGRVPFREPMISDEIKVFAQDSVVVDTSAYFEDFPNFVNCGLREGLAITYSWQGKNLY